MRLRPPSLDFTILPLPSAQRRAERLGANLARYDLSVDQLGRKCAEFESRGEVFVSGSMVTPLANAFSDIDLFVVGPEVAARGVLISHLGEARLDVEFWPLSDLDRIAETVRQSLDLSLPLERLRREELKFMNRVRWGISLPDVDRPLGVQRRLPETALRVDLCRRWLAHADMMVQDAAGALLAGQQDYALPRSREALGAAIDAYLALRGDTHCETKHRALRLVHLFDEPDLLELYKDACRGWPQEADECFGVAEAVLRVIRTLTTAVRRELDRDPETYLPAGTTP